MNTTSEMQLVPIDKLIPYVNNARTHSPEQLNKLRSSLREFGFINPVIIDRDFNVIAGHGRILAAKAENISEVPCVFVDYLTPAQKKAYIIADNRMALDAGWDEEMLKVEIEALQADDFDLGLTGFDEKELAAFFDDDSDTKDDDFDVDAEMEKTCITKPGDLWLLGNHRLVCGDSTKPETYEILMNGKQANLVVTDPPYNVNYEGSAGKIKNDNLENEKFYQFLLGAFTCMEKAMANDASIYVFHADTEGLNFRKAFADAGFYLSGTCIWKKQSLVLGRSPYQWQHEPCLFGWKKNGKHQWYSDRKQTTIWEFDKPKKNGDHPTMKPIPLIAYPIKNSSMSNCIVLDPFGGSGSTLIACEQTNRICHTIELDEKFCDVIVKRYIEQVGSAENVCATDGRYPRFAVWENVPGAFSSNKGEDFRCVLESLCRVSDETVSVTRHERWTAAGNIVADGFSIAWRVLDAQYWGVPQRRKRIFLVADFDSECAGKILFESEGLSGYSAEGFKAWQRAAAATESGSGTSSAICLNDQGGNRMDVTEEVKEIHSIRRTRICGHRVRLELRARTSEWFR